MPQNQWISSGPVFSFFFNNRNGHIFENILMQMISSAGVFTDICILRSFRESICSALSFSTMSAICCVFRLSKVCCFSCNFEKFYKQNVAEKKSIALNTSYISLQSVLHSIAYMQNELSNITTYFLRAEIFPAQKSSKKKV